MLHPAGEPSRTDLVRTPAGSMWHGASRVTSGRFLEQSSTVLSSGSGSGRIRVPADVGRSPSTDRGHRHGRRYMKSLVHQNLVLKQQVVESSLLVMRVDDCFLTARRMLFAALSGNKGKGTICLKSKSEMVVTWKWGSQKIDFLAEILGFRRGKVRQSKNSLTVAQSARLGQTRTERVKRINFGFFRSPFRVYN